MKTQSIKAGPVAPPTSLRTLRSGHVLPLGSSGGRLDVLHGRVWLTRQGDADDHVLAGGESVRVPAGGAVLVEAWDDASPALVAWQPGRALNRVAACAHRTACRCWEAVDPVRRIGSGAVAAVLALVAGASVFGPISEARSRELAQAVRLHNTAVHSAPTGVAATDGEGSSNDAGAATSGRTGFAAQAARRDPPGHA